jgi:hypothetical protein
MFALRSSPAPLCAHLAFIITLTVTATSVLCPLIRIMILLLLLLPLVLVTPQESITIRKRQARYGAVIHTCGSPTGRNRDWLHRAAHVRTQLIYVLAARPYLCEQAPLEGVQAALLRGTLGVLGTQAR